MKKKITAFILIIVLSLNMAAVSVGASEESSSEPLMGMDYIVKRLSIFTHEDRANIETILIPMLITDTGLDTLVKTVSEYTPESEALMHELLEKLLVRVDKDEVVRAISYLYMIDEKVREDYIGGYYERKELKLSTGGVKAMDTLMGMAFAEYPELEKIFEEDKITTGVAARFFKMFSDVNGGAALFKENKAGELEINVINADLAAKINSCLEKEQLGFATAEEFLADICKTLNAYGANSEYLKSFIMVGDEIGLVRRYVSSTESSGGGPGGAAPSKPQIDSVASAEDVVVDKGSGTITIGNKNADSLENTLFAVSFEYDKNGYLTDPDGEAVRLCVYDNGVWYALLEKTGVYTVEPSKDSYFTDVDGWGKSFINMLYERGIISGRGAETFCPDDNITREEFVKLIVELFGLKGDYGSFFVDVPQDAWYYEYVSAAKYYGIVDGYGDASFGVGKNITRQDMCKILYSVIQTMDIKIAESGADIEFADRSQIADYAYPGVMALKRADIISGDDQGRFNPADSATRQEAAKLIYKLLECYVKY